MGFKNHKAVVWSNIVALITFCYLLANEFACARTFGTRRQSLELVKHKGTIKTIESENDEVVDCVDIYKQPAFDHPLLKNHTIEIHPSFLQNGVEGKNNQALMALQGWHKNGECQEGTIPILRAPRYGNYQKGVPIISHGAINAGHEYAQVSLIGGRYYGVNATLNVWTPAAYGNGLFSVAQLWIISGPQEDVNTMEAGWIVYPGTTQTKFFIYWTADGYKKTGCFNLECPGFVQTNGRFSFGSAFEPVSTYNGPQQDIVITIIKNEEHGHWWLLLQNESIGYWPQSIFSRMTNGAEQINWGGEIVNDEPEGHHTPTQMGSGHFPREGYGKASYFRNIQYMDDANVFKDPEKLIPQATKPSCYDVQVGQDTSSDGGTFFYFGGPGYSDICPT